MKIINIGSDRKLFEKGSAVAERMVLYGARVDCLAVVVLTTRAHGISATPVKVSPTVTLYPTHSLNRFLYIFDALRCGRRITRDWQKSSSKNDILVTTQDPFESGVVGALLSHLTKTKLQVQIHTDFLSPFYVVSSILNRFRVVLARKIIPRADGIRVVSERVAESITRTNISTKKIPEVLPIYVDAVKFATPKPPAPEIFTRYESTILIVSRLEKEKGIESAFRAVAEAIKRSAMTSQRSVGLIIVGDGSERNALEALAQEIGIGHVTHFVGWKKSAELHAYYASATLFLQTSLYEGYGMSLVEAALSKCPIVTTDVGIAGYVLKNNESALITPVGDETALRDALTQTLGSVDMRIQRAHAAYAAVQQHLLQNSSTYVDAYVQLWQKCLEA